MLFDKKKSVSIILSKMGKDGKSSEIDVKPETGGEDEYTSFAEDILSAIKDGSVQKLAACLRDFHGLIQDQDEMQDEEKDEIEEQ